MSNIKGVLRNGEEFEVRDIAIFRFEYDEADEADFRRVVKTVKGWTWLGKNSRKERD